MLSILIVTAVASATTVGDAYPPPTGATRTADDAFGAWLQALPLRPLGTPIRTHRGGVVRHDGRPVSMPLVRGDLQQCADSVIRLRAEFARSRGAESDLSFHATSGDPLPWRRYASGEKPRAEGNRIVWSRVDPGLQTWDGWLSAVFMWAGTRSLAAYETVTTRLPKAGDMLVVGGSPGHAVMLLDVATRGDQTLLLIGEGYMPAQDFHVEHGPESGWWVWSDTGVDLGHWDMPRESLRRWR